MRNRPRVRWYMVLETAMNSFRVHSWHDFMKNGLLFQKFETRLSFGTQASTHLEKARARNRFEKGSIVASRAVATVDLSWLFR